MDKSQGINILSIKLKYFFSAFSGVGQCLSSLSSIPSLSSAGAGSAGTGALPGSVSSSGATGASSDTGGGGGITPSPANPIQSWGFTQDQVACVCEVLEQSGNVERLER